MDLKEAGRGILKCKNKFLKIDGTLFWKLCQATKPG